MTLEHGTLAQYFDGFGYKRLAPVEIDPTTSNEHEFNGISKFKELFGAAKRHFKTRIIYLCDCEDDILEETTVFTWYDARERHPKRSEYRLYYKDSVCIKRAAPNDLMIICVTKATPENETELTAFIAKHDDNIERQLAWLFGIQLDTVNTAIEIQPEVSSELDYYTEVILEKIGIESAPQQSGDLLHLVLSKFPSGFPKTDVFSSFAREIAPATDFREDPDHAISTWLEAEERAFRALESHFVQEKINNGFTSVDDFVNYSLSIHNRRKARAGSSLENHLRFLFENSGIHYSFNQVTENKTRPDFIFPDIANYRDPAFSPLRLTMLGVKTTCKDRWRQVLAEAERITHKHLLTLEPGISTAQTAEMRSSNLALVVPKQIFTSYTSSQQDWLLNISQFVDFVLQRQRSGA